MANYCHLSYEDRKNIEDGLNDKKSITQISKEINRSNSTIIREIDRNKVYYKLNNYGYSKTTDPKNLYKYQPCERLAKSPYEAMLFLCDENILKILNCYYIKPDDIILNSKLLK